MSLDDWCDAYAQNLRRSIRAHVRHFMPTDHDDFDELVADCEELERMIMISVRQWSIELVKDLTEK